MSRTFLAFLLFLTSGRQVAFGDLSIPPKTETGPQSVHVRGGGILCHAPHPLPGTPPVSLKLTRVVSMKEGTFIKDVVEVVMTNIGSTPISIPIGDDPVPLLAPTEKDRRYLEFSVTLSQGKAVRSIAAAESSALLQPGDTVLFWLPAGIWQATAQPASEDDTTQQVSVSG